VKSKERDVRSLNRGCHVKRRGILLYVSYVLSEAARLNSRIFFVIHFRACVARSTLRPTKIDRRVFQARWRESRDPRFVSRPSARGNARGRRYTGSRGIRFRRRGRVRNLWSLGGLTKRFRNTDSLHARASELAYYPSITEIPRNAEQRSNAGRQ